MYTVVVNHRDRVQYFSSSPTYCINIVIVDNNVDHFTILCLLLMMRRYSLLSYFIININRSICFIIQHCILLTEIAANLILLFIVVVIECGVRLKTMIA